MGSGGGSPLGPPGRRSAIFRELVYIFFDFDLVSLSFARNKSSERSEGKAKWPSAGQAAWFAGQVRRTGSVRTKP